jgi:cyclohexanone monooxygenase
MFLITGPQSLSVKAQMTLACEQHVDWIVDCLSHMKSKNLPRIEASQSAEGGWVTHNNEVADGTLYPLANSWYMGANIPGKPRISMSYVGCFDRYKRTCDDIAAKSYEGFTLTPARDVALVRGLFSMTAI